MRKFITAMFFALISVSLWSQDIKDDVTLTVTGEGATREEATNNALRSAIAQAYGVFVSADIQILNDEIVKDEIATVTSGNIKKYKEIASVEMPDGRKEVTVSATVSISKLINYAQSKGASAEFAGATFVRNLKIKELNKENEELVIASMVSSMNELYEHGFDYTISISESKATGELSADIGVIANANAEAANHLFYSTMKGLSLTESEVEEYKNLGMETTFFDVYLPVTERNEHKETIRFYLREDKSFVQLDSLFNYLYPKAMLNFRIASGVKDSKVELQSTYALNRQDKLHTINGHYVYDGATGYVINAYHERKRPIFTIDVDAWALSSTSHNEYPITSHNEYSISYICSEKGLGYIKKINAIDDLCYLSYPYLFPMDRWDFLLGPNFLPVLACYPEYKSGTKLHHIKLTMEIPIEDLMRISNFTISNGNE